MKNITIYELNKKIDSGEKIFLIDVREKKEVSIAKIDCAIHIPMNDIPNYINKLNKQEELIIMCKVGLRSDIVCKYLIENNFKNVRNLVGGIKAWAQYIDKTMCIK